MNRITEQYVFSQALVPQTISNSNVTSPYFKVKDSTRLAFLMQVGALAASKIATLEVLATGGATITGAAATLTANTLVSKATIALATVLAGQTITVNGLVYTAHATVTTAALRQFSIAGADSADATELLACLSDPTWGVPGITATANAATLTLVSSDPGETLISLSASDTTFTLATLEGLVFVELDNLDVEAETVACKVTSTGAGTVAVLLVEERRTSAPPKVAGAATI
jgi:hypothetical protein